MRTLNKVKLYVSLIPTVYALFKLWVAVKLLRLEYMVFRGMMALNVAIDATIYAFRRAKK